MRWLTREVRRYTMPRLSLLYAFELRIPPLWWPYVTLSPSDNTCDDVFFIAVRIPYYSALCAFYGVYRRDSSARTLLRSNRHPIWHGTSRLLFHVSRLRQGKSALYDDTSDRSYSLSRGLQVDLGTCLSLSLSLSPPLVSLSRFT